MSTEGSKTSDYRLKIINTWIAGISAIGVIATIWFGLSGVRRQSQAQMAALREQWNKSFYDEKISIYSRATEAAGRIAALKHAGGSEEELRSALIEFRTLFWGPMCITEDPDVEEAMVKFHSGASTNIPTADFEQLALYLAHVCKNEAHSHYFNNEGPASTYGTNDKILEKMTKLIEKQQGSKKPEQ